MYKIFCWFITIFAIFLICLMINIPVDEKYITAIFGLIGVVSGSIITIIGTIIREWYMNRGNEELEKRRIELLTEMLNNKQHQWRNISTLSNVIGANKDETRRLLIKLKARGSETNNESEELWGLISKHPLPSER